MLATEPKVLTLEEAAAELRCSTKTVLRRLAAGDLDGFKAGGWRITRQALDAFKRQADKTVP